MNLKKIIVSAILLTAFVSVVSTGYKPAKASVVTKATPPTIKNTSLSKKGFVVRLTKNISGQIYVGKANYQKILNSTKPLKKAKTVKFSKVRNIKFKIVKIAEMNTTGFGAPEYLVTSKGNKYSCWTTRTGLQYYYWNSKSMHQVSSLLTKLINNSGSFKNKKNQKLFNEVVKAAKKLPASQRKFVLQSLNQIKKDGSVDKREFNILLFEF